MPHPGPPSGSPAASSSQGAQGQGQGQGAPSEPPLDLQAYPILVVDDEPDNLDAFCFNFRRAFRILTAASGEAGLKALREDPNRPVAVIVTDQRMPRMSGLEFIKEARALCPDAVPIILTAYTDLEVLIEAISLGHIYRYITKPWDAKEMRGVLTQAVERYHLRRENRRLQEQLRQYAGYLTQEMHGAFEFGQLVGDSPALCEVLGRVEQVAKTHTTVLLRGETGTGKELVAHAIHINSPREGKPFVRVNCAALASGVLESELFGHEKGAFTGAAALRRGRFEQADHGTLFLDEIGDMPAELQTRLLRVLSEGSFYRVGGHQPVKANVRVIAATHQDLEGRVKEGLFREDLFHRLNVIRLRLPPLRERREDIPLLAKHFLQKSAQELGGEPKRLTEAALKYLQGLDFPGNVRQLENLCHWLTVMAPGQAIEIADLPPELRAQAPRETEADWKVALGAEADRLLAGRPGAVWDSLAREFERTLIRHALLATAGRRIEAAQLLGIGRNTITRKIQELGMENDNSGEPPAKVSR